MLRVWCAMALVLLLPVSPAAAQDGLPECREVTETVTNSLRVLDSDLHLFYGESRVEVWEEGNGVFGLQRVKCVSYEGWIVGRDLWRETLEPGDPYDPDPDDDLIPPPSSLPEQPLLPQPPGDDESCQSLFDAVSCAGGEDFPILPECPILQRIEDLRPNDQICF